MPTGTVEECIALVQAAVARAETPAFLSDAGDNITGGGVGDVPFVLGRMLAHGLENAVFAAIADAAAVASAFDHGIDATVNLSLGGKLDAVNGTPLAVTGTVLALHTAGADRQAVILVDGIKVVVTSRRTAFTTVVQFEALGLDLTQHAIVGIKLGYLFPDLRRIAAYACLAFSPGAINPDLTQLPYRDLARPVYPLDAGMDWQPPG
ncbi:MAG: MlrC C-terminal domain-containing protein [Caldilineaceae bacterium]